MSEKSEIALNTQHAHTKRVCVISWSGSKLKLKPLLLSLQQQRAKVIFFDSDANIDEVMALTPGAVVIDATGDMALQWVTDLHAHDPNLPLAMICDGTAPATCLQGLQQGASGVLSSKTTPELIELSLHEILKGGAVLYPKLARAVLIKMRQGEPLHFDPPTAAPDESKPILTRRELESLHLLNRGLKQREIANILEVSPNTVATLVRRAYKKLGVKSKLQATQKALSLGLIEKD